MTGKAVVEKKTKSKCSVESRRSPALFKKGKARKARFPTPKARVRLAESACVRTTRVLFGTVSDNNGSCKPSTCSGETANTVARHPNSARCGNDMRTL